MKKKGNKTTSLDDNSIKKDVGTGLYDLGVAIGGEGGGLGGKDNPNAEEYDDTLMRERISIGKPEREDGGDLKNQESK